MQVVDLFCGLGGFSAGAIEAGAEVILGVDHDSVPLKLWAANIPGARAKLAKLGSDGTQIDLPPASPSLHVHTSPPCTDLSLARGGKLPAADVEAGIQMIRWALDLVLERGDESWSLENVSTPKTREVLTEYATRFPGLVGWTTLDAAEFGAAQTRIRLIAAPMRLIEVLQEMPSARRVSVRDMFASRALEVPATHFKNQTRNRNGFPCVRSVEEQSFTVCASHALTWCDRDGKTHKVMTARESAILMGFSDQWRLPQGCRTAQKAVGNALCTAMSRSIMQAAMHLHAGTPVFSTPTPLTARGMTPQASTVPDLLKADEQSSEEVLDNRLRTIESLIRGLHETGASAAPIV